MSSIRVHRRLLRWGNAWGLRLTQDEVRRLGAKERQRIEAEIHAQPEPLDPDTLPSLDLSRDAARRHDAIIGEGLSAGG